jgi:hypothetical protein
VKSSHIPEISAHSKKLISNTKKTTKNVLKFVEEPVCFNRLYVDAFEHKDKRNKMTLVDRGAFKPSLIE